MTVPVERFGSSVPVVGYCEGPSVGNWVGGAVGSCDEKRRGGAVRGRNLVACMD
jgi:hypothetical protein